MVNTPSTMLPLGTQLPGFDLPDYDGKMHSSQNFDSKPVLVMFICNHCPFVKHIVENLSERTKEYQAQGVQVVAIMSNDIDKYPDDSPEKMKEFAEQHNFSFPYLYDESQEVAKAYHAACTPDLYLFNPDHELVYRGQFDSSRPGKDIPVTGEDLTNAVENLMDGEPISTKQTPSIGCNIKWKAGNSPDYFTN